MRIVLNCCRCNEVDEVGTDLICRACGELGWRPRGEEEPVVDREALRRMSKVLNYEPQVVGKARTEVLGQILERAEKATKRVLPPGVWRAVSNWRGL